MGDDGANVQGYTFVLGEEVAPGSFAVKSGVFHGQTDDKLIVYSAMMDFLGEATIAEVKADQGDVSQHVVTLKDVNMVGKLTSGSRFGMISQHPRRVVIPGSLVDCVVVAEPEHHAQTYATPYSAAYAAEIMVPADVVRLTQWVSEYYLAGPGATLHLWVPAIAE